MPVQSSNIHEGFFVPTNLNPEPENDPTWIPSQKEGIFHKPLLFDLTNNNLTLMIYARQKVSTSVHYHTGSATAFILKGAAEFTELDQKTQRCEVGSFLYEPAGVIHQGVLDPIDDIFLAHSTIAGSAISLDENYEPVVVLDAFAFYERAKQQYIKNNIPVSKLDALVL